jgi:hypothetical protein
VPPALNSEERERRELLIEMNTRGSFREIARKLPDGYTFSAQANPSVPGVILIFKCLGRGEIGRVYVTFNCRDMSVKNIRGRVNAASDRMLEMKGISDTVHRVLYEEGLLETLPPVAGGVLRGMEMAESEAIVMDFKELTGSMAEKLPEGAAIGKVAAGSNPKGLTWYFTHSKFGLLGLVRMNFLAEREEIRALLGKTDDFGRARHAQDDAASLDDDMNGPPDLGADKFSLVNMYSSKDDGYMTDRRDLMTEIGEAVNEVLSEKTGCWIMHLHEFGSPQISTGMASDFYDSPQVLLQLRQDASPKIPIEMVAEAERAIAERLREPRARLRRRLYHMSDWVHTDASIHVQESRVTFSFIHEGMGKLGYVDVTLGSPGMAPAALSHSVSGSDDGRGTEREELMREIFAAAKEAFGCF